MKLLRPTIIGTLIAGWPLLALADQGTSEGKARSTTQEGWVAKSDWQRRVLQQKPTTHSGPEQATVDQQRSVRWSPSRQQPLRTASRTTLASEEVVIANDADTQSTPLPTDGGYDSMGMGGPEMCLAGTGCGECMDEDCGCGGYCGGYRPGLFGLRSEWWARDLSLMVGAHGFKGPFDLGRNGNFGLHEGVNFGSPLGGPWDWGYQVGFAAVHSNFSGDQTTGAVRRADRDQFFFTTGIFHRALAGGIQWGVTLDLLRDVYYAKADMKQIRTEIGYVFPGGQGEIGYWGAYGVDDDEIVIDLRTVSFEPTDQFAFYYRRHFQGGGEGRFWGGFTGWGDGLLGADCRVPLGGSWAIESRVNYLVPNEGRGYPGQAEESWGLSVRLVWHLGQPARSAQRSPYRPMLDVADNSLFMFDMF